MSCSETVISQIPFKRPLISSLPKVIINLNTNVRLLYLLALFYM